MSRKVVLILCSVMFLITACVLPASAPVATPNVVYMVVTATPHSMPTATQPAAISTTVPGNNNPPEGVEPPDCPGLLQSAPTAIPFGLNQSVQVEIGFDRINPATCEVFPEYKSIAVVTRIDAGGLNAYRQNLQGNQFIYGYSAGGDPYTFLFIPEGITGDSGPIVCNPAVLTDLFLVQLPDKQDWHNAELIGKLGFSMDKALANFGQKGLCIFSNTDEQPPEGQL